MSYMVEHIAEAAMNSRMNQLAAEGWTLVSVIAHPHNTEQAAPIYVTVWRA